LLLRKPVAIYRLMLIVAVAVVGVWRHRIQNKKIGRRIDFFSNADRLHFGLITLRPERLSID
jgi:hypothetical protein